MHVDIKIMIVKNFDLFNFLEDICILMFCYFIIFLFLISVDYNDSTGFVDRKILVGLLVITSFLPLIYIENSSTNFRKIYKLDFVLYYTILKILAVILSLDIARGLNLIYPLPFFTFLNLSVLFLKHFHLFIDI